MTRNISWGFADTPVNGESTTTLTRPLINYAADYGVKRNTPQETILVNKTSPLDRTEKIRIAYTDIADIYKDTGIDASVKAPSARGISVVSQVNAVLSVTDTTDVNYRIDLPVHAHIVLRAPISENFNAELAEDIIARAVSTLYDTGSNGVSRLDSILRGALKPKDL